MPISVDRGMSLISEFCANYPVACKIQYLVRNTQEEAFHEKATSERFGKLYAAYFPTSRYAAFATSNFRDEGHFERALRHEILGHFGINTFTAQEKAAILGAILEARSQPLISALWEQVDTLYVDTPLLVKAEEVYAYACEAITPGQQVNVDDGMRSFNEVCVARLRPMELLDLSNITSMVALGLSDRSRTQQNFPASDREQFRLGEVVVFEGTHVGMILDISNGAVTQKVNRSGHTVMHLLGHLSRPVEVGSVVNIHYEDGKGRVQGLAAGVHRGR